MKFGFAAKRQEAPALAEITLSKTTYSSSVPMPLKKRIWWLKYELPSSLSGIVLLPSIGLLAVCQLATMPFIYEGLPLHRALTHPQVLGSVLGILLFSWAAVAALVLAVTFVFLINPRELLNLFVFPDMLRITENTLELKWTKTQACKRVVSIPWSWISQVRMRDYLQMGVIPLRVLEIELSEIPADYHAWKMLEKVSRDGVYFFDPATNKMAEKFKLSGIRLPLPLFGFSTDVDLLIDFIRKKCGEETIDASAVNEENNTSRIESFTALWLEELNSRQTRDLQRLLPPGTSLQDDTYTITGVLGTGGLSVVYQALDKKQDGTAVAIKEILCNFGGTKKSVEKNVKQILNEVCLLRRLDHPNIVKFNAFFAEGTKLYIVMDLINGCNARTYVEDSKPLNEDELLEIARQCCSILNYLHEQPEQIVHRDFTPDNLMLSEGTVKLIDFNIAQSAITNSSHTVMGKHCFMAPEQFCGEASIASDLYQLGTTLYFLSTGTDPEPLSPCDIHAKRPDLSNEFHQLVKTLTDRDPARRPATAKNVLEAISALAKADTSKCVEVV